MGVGWPYMRVPVFEHTTVRRCHPGTTVPMRTVWVCFLDTLMDSNEKSLPMRTRKVDALASSAQ